ncbi:ankyrin repeat-containing domain protein [Aspergillus germanicus]
MEKDIMNTPNSDAVKGGLAEMTNRTRPEMALHLAAKLGNLSIMALLLEYGAAIDSRDSAGNTALYQAAWRHRHDAVSFLLEAGASTDSPGPAYASVLHLAANINDVELLKLVLPFCDDFHIPVRSADFSPLSCCVSWECVRYLEGQGYGLGDVDTYGGCPLYFLMSVNAMQGFILQADLLRKHGLDQTRVNLEHMDDKTLAAILQYIPRLLRAFGKDRVLAMFPSEPRDGYSALCLAARCGDLECCRALVSMGTSLDFEGHDNGTALEVAIRCRQFGMVKYLVRAGASIIYYSKRDGQYKSAFAPVHWYPRRYQTIYRWILVDRYTEQRKICS